MRTVVVVDDDADVMQMVHDLLEDEGMACLAVADPARVEAAARAGRPDAFLIDMMLSKRSGIELAQELRDGGFRQPLIAMSASAFMAELARESGLFDAVIEKPFDPDELLISLCEAVPT